jgi:hypothetical protein
MAGESANADIEKDEDFIANVLIFWTPLIRWRKSGPSMLSHQPFQTAFAKGVLRKILGHLLLNVMMKSLCGEVNISDI